MAFLQISAVLRQRKTRKLIAGFSWKLNPLREHVAKWSYAAFYAPGSVLGLAEMFLARRRRETLLIAMAFVSFMGVTAVFWAHTSHRSYLDVQRGVPLRVEIAALEVPGSAFPKDAARFCAAGHQCLVCQLQ